MQTMKNDTQDRFKVLVALPGVEDPVKVHSGTLDAWEAQLASKVAASMLDALGYPINVMMEVIHD